MRGNLRCVSCKNHHSHGHERIDRGAERDLFSDQKEFGCSDGFRPTILASRRDIPELLKALAPLKIPNHLS